MHHKEHTQKMLCLHPFCVLTMTCTFVAVLLFFHNVYCVYLNLICKSLYMWPENVSISLWSH